MDQLTANDQTSTVATTGTAAQTDAVYEDKITKLAGLTRRGAVKWHTVDASAIPTLSFARVLTAYEASFGGERLRLIETGYGKQYPLTGLGLFLDGFVGRGGLSSMFPTTKANDTRINEIQSIALSLHLLDLNGQPTFKFPSVASVYDLLGEVKTQQSDIAGFLNAIDAAAAEEQHP